MLSPQCIRDDICLYWHVQEAAGGGAGGRPEQILEVRSMRQKIDALLNLALLEVRVLTSQGPRVREQCVRAQT